MGRRTVSLDGSTYERLKAAKRPGESFSMTVHRILEWSRPTYRSLAGTLTGTEARGVWAAVRRMRDAEAPAERAHSEAVGLGFGRYTRH